MDVEKARSQVISLESELGRLRKERDDFAAELGDTKKQLTSQRAGTQHLDDLIDKLQRDKKQLGLRVNKLTAIGKSSQRDCD